MLALGCIAYVYVSAPLSFIRQGGLHLHPMYGVAAFLLTIWSYRQLMCFLPTALALTLPSALLSGAISWAISKSASSQQVGTLLGQLGSIEFNAIVPMFREHVLPAINGWTVAAFSVCLLSHLAYWWHRRAIARTHGWVINRPITETFTILLVFALVAGIGGWMISNIH